MSQRRTVIYRTFSPQAGRLYALVQEGEDVPNLEIAGIRMKSAAPTIAAVLEASLRELRPLAGVCLDTCGGLGYSAIAMAEAPAVTRVVCYEVDTSVLEVARHNPASAALFTDPKIDLHNEDVYAALDAWPDASLDRVFHDPPRLGLAGELYSHTFYDKLFRVMRSGAKLFHYTGAPGEKAGKRIVAGVIRRLTEAGFERVRPVPAAQGVAATKPAAARRP